MRRTPCGGAQAGSRLARAQDDATHALRGRGADDAPRLQLLKLLLPSTSCAEVGKWRRSVVCLTNYIKSDASAHVPRETKR